MFSCFTRACILLRIYACALTAASLHVYVCMCVCMYVCIQLVSFSNIVPIHKRPIFIRKHAKDLFPCINTHECMHANIHIYAYLQAYDPSLKVDVCHTYEINYKYRYTCTQCDKEYGRHSNSIDVTKKVCMYVCIYVCMSNSIDVTKKVCMYVCMYICMYVKLNRCHQKGMYVCMCVCMCVRMSNSIDVTKMYVSMYVSMCVRMSNSIDVTKKVCMYVCMYVCVYVCQTQ